MILVINSRRFSEDFLVPQDLLSERCFHLETYSRFFVDCDSDGRAKFQSADVDLAAFNCILFKDFPTCNKALYSDPEDRLFAQSEFNATLLYFLHCHQRKVLNYQLAIPGKTGLGSKLGQRAVISQIVSVAENLGLEEGSLQKQGFEVSFYIDVFVTVDDHVSFPFRNIRDEFSGVGKLISATQISLHRNHWDWLFLRIAITEGTAILSGVGLFPERRFDSSKYEVLVRKFFHSKRFSIG